MGIRTIFWVLFWVNGSLGIVLAIGKEVSHLYQDYNFASAIGINTAQIIMALINMFDNSSETINIKIWLFLTSIVILLIIANVWLLIDLYRCKRKVALNKLSD